MFLFDAGARAQQQAGSIRGVVYDRDFDTPLAAAQVQAVETGQKTSTSDQGHFVLSQVPPGRYTLIFSKEGYVRQVKTDVVVTAGQLTDLDISLAGEFTEMDEFVVQDLLQAGGGSEAALLKMRFESPALMDSISSDLMSKAGASDAAAALRLVAGASVADGKSAVIRGLPDRYVSSQMNGVTLPTADEDKRAVELDQFPAAVIESIQVSKTFTPDQQGDASGGAVNVRLKGIPDETTVQFKGQLSGNSQVWNSDFLTYDGGGTNFWGRDYGDRAIQFDNLGDDWNGAVGSKESDAPFDSKWSFAAGGKQELDDGVKLGGFLSLFYEADSAFYDDGINDSFWVESPGHPMTPETNQGQPSDGDFKTALFDVTQGRQSVQWGGLATLGIESENHAIALTYLYTRTAEDVATLAVDTRGKEYFFPGYDPNDPAAPGNTTGLNAAPYLRTETLEYTERTTGTLQLTGQHKLPIDDYDVGGLFNFHAPEVDWILADSNARLDQPDKRQFGAYWLPPSLDPGAPPFIPPFVTEPTWYGLKPSSNFTLGNLQRIWKEIEEDSQQYAVNVKLPFSQWSEDDGYVKGGWYDNKVDRTFDQDTFSNFNDNSTFIGGWDEPWSDVFPSENGHAITESLFDVDYKGDLEVEAWYGMVDLPIFSSLNLIAGARYESTDIGIVNQPESSATWFPPGATAPVALNPGDGDVKFGQNDVLPSVGLVWVPLEQVTLRGSYSQTVARQTFKELTPIIQQEYLGAPIFIGNPDLGMSDLTNYDLRVDYVPYTGGLLSASWFKKDIQDPIEYVQRYVGFTFTTPVNYPRGNLEGWELELRQELGVLYEPLGGLAFGANATFISSQVTLPDNEAAEFNLPNIKAPMSTRDMTNAPDHLFNLYATYDLTATRTQFALFYTVQGDTLVAGAGISTGNFVPSVYAKQFDTLNLSITQALGDYLKLQFQAKNLTNPEIETVYRSKYIGKDVTKTSYTTGIEYSITLGMEFRF